MDYQNYIDGKWTTAKSGNTFPVRNPATGTIIAEVPDCGAEETKEAIDAAYRSFHSWKIEPAQHRYQLLYRIYEKIVEEKEHLAQIISMENGKPLAEALGEVDFGANFFLWYAEEAKRIWGGSEARGTKR